MQLVYAVLEVPGAKQLPLPLHLSDKLVDSRLRLDGIYICVFHCLELTGSIFVRELPPAIPLVLFVLRLHALSDLGSFCLRECHSWLVKWGLACARLLLLLVLGRLVRFRLLYRCYNSELLLVLS